jgi:hypothetical protein
MCSGCDPGVPGVLRGVHPVAQVNQARPQGPGQLRHCCIRSGKNHLKLYRNIQFIRLRQLTVEAVSSLPFYLTLCPWRVESVNNR